MTDKYIIGISTCYRIIKWSGRDVILLNQFGQQFYQDTDRMALNNAFILK